MSHPTFPSLFGPCDPDKLQDFENFIRDDFPGGKRLADHVHEGPWRILVTRNCYSEYRASSLIMKTYPGLAEIRFDDTYENGSIGDAWLLPDFAAHILYWESNGEDMHIEYEADITLAAHLDPTVPGWDTPEIQAQILTAWLTHDFPDILGEDPSVESATTTGTTVMVNSDPTPPEPGLWSYATLLPHMTAALKAVGSAQQLRTLLDAADVWEGDMDEMLAVLTACAALTDQVPVPA